jgi:hypothetical protein
MEQAQKLKLDVIVMSTAAGIPFYKERGFQIVRTITQDFSKWGTTTPRVMGFLIKEVLPIKYLFIIGVFPFLNRFCTHFSLSSVDHVKCLTSEKTLDRFLEVTSIDKLTSFIDRSPMYTKMRE